MAILSKLASQLQGAPVLTTTCHETFHTWHPDCTLAWVDAIPQGLKFSLRTYATFYLGTLLLTSGGDIKSINWKKFLQDVVRSSVFLSTNLVLYLFFLCRIRALLGFFTIPTIGYANGIIASYFSILIENQKRRPALALYLTNLASETLFRQLVNHGYLKTIPGGTFIPFAIGLALFKFLSTRGALDKSLGELLSTVLQDSPKSANRRIVGLGKKVEKSLPRSFKEVLEALKKECGGKTSECEHDSSCVYNASVNFAHNATFGFALSSILTVVQNLKKVVLSPKALPGLLLSKRNMKIPLFFGLLPLIYHSSRCLLNRIPRNFPRPSPDTRDVIAASISGLSMTAFPNISIAMYTMWKGIEAMYGYGVDLGYLRWIKHGDIFLYAISTGYVLGCATYEPHAVRKGYIQFLEGLTGDKITQFNRQHFDFYGALSSKLYGLPKDNDRRFLAE